MTHCNQIGRIVKISKNNVIKKQLYLSLDPGSVTCAYCNSQHSKSSRTKEHLKINIRIGVLRLQHQEFFDSMRNPNVSLKHFKIIYPLHTFRNETNIIQELFFVSSRSRHILVSRDQKQNQSILFCCFTYLNTNVYIYTDGSLYSARPCYITHFVMYSILLLRAGNKYS